MDASSLRWVLAIIGVVVIVGIYLYSIYQDKLRRRAAIKTFTHEELETYFIEDENLKKELSNIDALLDEKISDDDISEISINPGLEDDTKKQQAMDSVSNKSGSNKSGPQKTPLQLPDFLAEINPDNLVAHILQRSDDQLLTAEELSSAFAHTGFELDNNNFFALNDDTGLRFDLLNMTDKGSFENFDDPEFCSPGLVCYFDTGQCDYPVRSYDLMLKKIDELVRVLDLKVYNHDFQLLTLQHVTEIRTRIGDD